MRLFLFNLLTFVLIPAAVMAGTVLALFAAKHTAPGDFLPLMVGLTVFAGLVCWLTHWLETPSS